MRLHEALESGRRFRQTSEGDTWFSVYGARVWSQEEVLADDWEVEEETISVTVLEISNMVRDVNLDAHYPRPEHPNLSTYIQKLINRGYK